MGRAHEVRAAAMAKTAAMKSKVYSRYGKEIYIAAKSGVPDPDMNLTLRAKIKEAKANQVPADVIKRAIEKAKGGSSESYDSLRYEGFGPGAATVIVDCLTDNSNRTIAAMNQCFNKAHCKLGVKGSVSFNYDNLGVISFNYEDEDKMLDTLIEADVDVNDLEVEEGVMTVYVAPADLHKAQEAIDALIPNVEYSVCAIKMLPQEYTTITDEHDKELWNRLLTLLDEVDDVQEVYHNVIDAE
ncbi:MAG: YebC/PmpR family DNA-binding transcriptional regulator [Erysipelotrichaceae bacterium]|nr:YebC/PmpR family DNA-binding transcriptional regulator [Erysipelotrichaceae bacterium]